jgi:hypothetical protein
MNDLRANIAFTDDQLGRLKILDESLSAYGFQSGDLVLLQTAVLPPVSLPVWELDDHLHAMFIDISASGWGHAHTSFLSATTICSFLSPDKMERVRMLGWIGLRRGC